MSNWENFIAKFAEPETWVLIGFALLITSVWAYDKLKKYKPKKELKIPKPVPREEWNARFQNDSEPENLNSIGDMISNLKKASVQTDKDFEADLMHMRALLDLVTAKRKKVNAYGKELGDIYQSYRDKEARIREALSRLEHAKIQ